MSLKLGSGLISFSGASILPSQVIVSGPEQLALGDACTHAYAYCAGLVHIPDSEHTIPPHPQSSDQLAGIDRLSCSPCSIAS